MSRFRKGTSRPFGIHFVALVIGLGALQIGLRHMQRGLLLAQRRQQIVLIQFADHLALVHDIAHVHRQLLDDAAGLALDFHLGDRLNLAGGHHRPRQIDPLHLRQLFRVDLRRFRPIAFSEKNAAPPNSGTSIKSIHLTDRFLREVAICVPEVDTNNGRR